MAVALPFVFMHINFHLPCQEFIGTWESLAKQSVMARAKFDTLIIAFMRLVMENDVNTMFGGRIDHCLADMDLALCRHWSNIRPPMKEITCLNAFAQELALVMEVDDLNAVVASEGMVTCTLSAGQALYGGSHCGEGV